MLLGHRKTFDVSKSNQASKSEVKLEEERQKGSKRPVRVITGPKMELHFFMHISNVHMLCIVFLSFFVGGVSHMYLCHVAKMNFLQANFKLLSLCSLPCSTF